MLFNYIVELLVFIIVSISARKTFDLTNDGTQCVNQPLTSNTNGVQKAVSAMNIPCSCGLCENLDYSEYLTFYYTTDGIKYDTNPVNVGFHIGGKTAVIIHGYCDQVNTISPYWMVALMQALIPIENYKNGILIDYSPFCCNYTIVANTIAPQMGAFLANYLLGLELHPELITILGHSLGAHIAGYTGASFNDWNLGSLEKIVALCKAAPLFDGTNKGLNKTCATTVVDVIADNGDIFGSNEPRGSVMYYINPWSSIQPSCSVASCNHQMCYHYYYASANSMVLNDRKRFRGQCCGQTPECRASDQTSKLSPFSGKRTGCYCMNATACFNYVT